MAYTRKVVVIPKLAPCVRGQLGNLGSDHVAAADQDPPHKNDPGSLVMLGARGFRVYRVCRVLGPWDLSPGIVSKPCPRSAVPVEPKTYTLA